MSDEKLTRDQQREAARAKAKAIREAQKKGEGRRKVTILVSVLAAIIAIISLIVWAVLGASTGSTEKGASPKTALFNGGISIGADLAIAGSAQDVDSSVTEIVLYEDPQCPICKAFEEPIMPAILELVKTGKYSLELHPISFLDGRSANEYSSRAASAMLCAADFAPTKFLDFHKSLFTKQPEENTSGPSSEELATSAREVGISDQKALDCITSNKYATWAKNQGRDIFIGKVPGSTLTFGGTPFVMVEGQQYQIRSANPADFIQWLETVAPVAK
jgi:protein-disulfide isomerase